MAKVGVVRVIASKAVVLCGFLYQYLMLAKEGKTRD